MAGMAMVVAADDPAVTKQGDVPDRIFLRQVRPFVTQGWRWE